ncbi:hypothetical protein ABZY42_19985 [Streptomyces sp. NPDC006622]|uniref:hypothetical protein n=1 Tax=Streptomyces sp. NPDC006622 TaxID=3155459 RepID=UPI0033ACAA14
MYRGKGHFGRRDTGLVLFLRVLMLLVAVAGLVLCVERAELRHPAVVLYKSAPACPVGTPWESAKDCVARTAGEVAGKGTSESCTTDSHGLSSCTTNYSVRVRFGGRAQSLAVGKNTYDGTDRGDRAELRLWRGEVVRMVVGGHVESYLTSSEWALAGWLILGWALAAAAWLALFGLWLYPLLAGWLVLAVPYLAVAYNQLGLNPMGVVGWSVTGLCTVAGGWIAVHLFRTTV